MLCRTDAQELHHSVSVYRFTFILPSPRLATVNKLGLTKTQQLVSIEVFC